MRRREPMLTGPDRRFDPAQIPATLMEPSMEAGQPNPAPGTSGWECPRCHVVWGPHVDRCTCEPRVTGGRTEIAEGGFEPTSQAMRRAGITPEDALNAG